MMLFFNDFSIIHPLGVVSLCLELSKPIWVFLFFVLNFVHHLGVFIFMFACLHTHVGLFIDAWSFDYV